MKTSTLFKSLSAYKIEPAGEWFDLLKKNLGEVDMFQWEAGDPNGQQWESIGLQGGAFGFAQNEFFRDVDGKGFLCFIRMSKRNLPVRVIREEVDRLAADIEAETGRKPGRKERRALQDDATMMLLPKAFIGHSLIPVIFTSDGLMLIFTTTPKRSNTILSYFLAFFSESFGSSAALTSYLIAGEISPTTWMTGKALALRDDRDDDELFYATDFAVMKGDKMGMIRVKDRELGCAEVATALKSGYRIEQIGLHHVETHTTFRMNLQMSLMQISFGEDVLGEMRENMEDNGDEMHATAWMVITEYRKVLSDLAKDMKIGDTTDEEEDW